MRGRPGPSRSGRLRTLAGIGGVLATLAVALLVARAGLFGRNETQSLELINRLAGARSPYLRSAADQPVAWQQWGPDAFELARKLGRPIWLDIGAIWCHWCHVMDRESYGSPEIAALINRSFVPIKVDRDERPDIDHRYQVAHQMLAGRGGGWPLTVFTTPDGEPFGSGTYFPPETRGGRPGIRELVPQVAAAYRDQRGRIEGITRQVREGLGKIRAAASAGGTFTPDLPERIANAVRAQFDPEYGGFGTRGPKFFTPAALRLDLAEGFLRGDTALSAPALRTVEAYARSGIRDHLHGGFFRYSVTRELTVPHFEKMDYLQAGLLRAYIEAFLLTGDSAYADVARDIMRYVDASLSDRVRGGFYPHQDADVSLDDDGSYYTWSRPQLEAAVPPAEAEALALYFDIQPRGEMAAEPTQNVLRIVRTPAQVARTLAIDRREAGRRILEGTRHLREARRDVSPPSIEHTKFTDRNGMMVVAYLEEATALGDDEARDFALRTADLLLDRAVEADGTVRHAVSADASYVDGLLGDYAHLAEALLAAFQVSGRARYLQAARRIMTRAVELLWDDDAGGFFDRREEPGAQALLAERTKEFADGSQPGPNSVAAAVLDRLYLLTEDDEWRDLAERTLAAFAGQAADAAKLGASWALAAEAHFHSPPQTVVIGGSADSRTGALASAAWHTYRPGRLAVAYDPSSVRLDSLPEAVGAAARLFRNDPTPRAYVCVENTCAPPTTSPKRVAELVRDFGRAPR
ncbi:MAG: thioredoxin domain-containing protein [Gemmatimonadota bacterium]